MTTPTRAGHQKHRYETTTTAIQRRQTAKRRFMRKMTGTQNWTRHRPTLMLSSGKEFHLDLLYTSPPPRGQHPLSFPSTQILQPSCPTSRPTTSLTPLTTRSPFPGFKTRRQKKTKSRPTIQREKTTRPPSSASISKAPSSHRRKASKYRLTKDSIIMASHPRVLVTPFRSLLSLPDRHCPTSDVLHIR